MGQPEKSNDQSENDAILPPKIEILSDLDNYQEKIESQWESAKANYQEKVNQILDEFIQENLRNQQPPDPPSAKKAAPPPNFSKSDSDFSKEKSDSSKQEKESVNFSGQQSDAEARLESLLSRAEKVVRMVDKKTRHISPQNFSTAPFQLDWHSEPASAKLFRHLKRFTPWIAGVIALISLCWFFVEIPSSYALPYSHATGIMIDHNKIYVVDWFRKSVFIHQMKRGFPISSVENLPNQFITGFSKTNNKVWSVDGMTHEFLSHSLTSEHLVVDRIKTPGNKPTGLYFDETDLWSMDDDAKVLYRHHASDLEDIKATYAIPPMSLSGLVVRKNKVWILSEKSRLIREFRLEDPLRELQTIDLDTFLEGSSVTSFALDDDNNMWLTTESPTKLLRIPAKKINR